MGGQRRDGVGFWCSVVGFFLVMSFLTLPTPLYGLLEQRDGFGTFTVSVVFAAYGLGVMTGLLLAGHVSDHVGRRPVVLAVVGLELACALGFALLEGTAWLLVLRFVSGLGVGALSATATAAVAELHERWRPGTDGTLGRTAANVANLGGLAVGPLVAALLSLLPHPLHAPFLAYLGVLALAGALLWRAPETVPAETRAEPWRYRPQRVAVDPEVRPALAGAAAAALAGFTVMGFVSGLTGVFLADVVGTSSRVAVGAVATTVLSGAVVSQLLTVRASVRARLGAGAAAVSVGVVGMAAAALLASLPLFVAGGAVALGGVGLVFSSSVATVSGLAAPERRSETLAALFLAGYLGITAPVVLIGAALLVADVVVVLVVVAGLVLLTVPTGIAVVLRRTAEDDARAGTG